MAVIVRGEEPIAATARKDYSSADTQLKVRCRTCEGWFPLNRMSEDGCCDSCRDEKNEKDKAVIAERQRIRDGVLAYYAVAPKAADPLLRIIDNAKEE